MSLKGDKYETAEEVKFRLEGTVVLYDGEPVYINKVNPADADDRKEISRVYFYNLPLGGGEAKLGGGTRKYLSSKKFDLTPFKMGYFNHKGEASFVSRNPVRQNKQGLCTMTAMFMDCRGRRSETMNFNEMLRAKGFVDMVAGTFPSFKEAGDLLGDKAHSSIAISRSFAFWIDHDIESLFLMHKGIRCGLALKNDKALKIPPKFHFLREEMEEHRIPLA